jgi:hypothetical protein
MYYFYKKNKLMDRKNKKKTLVLLHEKRYDDCTSGKSGIHRDGVLLFAAERYTQQDEISGSQCGE